MPTNPFSVGSPGAGLAVQNAESKSYAGFAQATWSPEFAGSRLHLTAGLRYSNDKKSFLRTVSNGVPENTVGKPFKESRFDPAFTIAYDAADQLNIYARYAQAYRAGGVSVRSPMFRPFGAEVNKSFELGLKSYLLDRRLQFNAALFENKIYNRQITAQLDPTGNPAITDTLNAPGATRIRGLELDVVAAPTRNLTFTVNYSYMKGKRPPSYRLIDPNAELRIQSLPEHAVTAMVDYVGPETAIGRPTFHFDYSMASDTPGTGRVAYGAYAWDIERDVANGRIGLREIPIGPAGFSLAFFAKNVFNNAYTVYTAPGSVIVLAPPRTYGLELGVQF